MRDYDELIKRLRNCTSDTVEDCAGCPYQGGYKGTYCMNGLISEAADAIEELSNIVEQYKMYLQDALNDLKAAHEKEPKWIPVTERLPVRGDAVLCIGDNGINIADFVIGDKWSALPWFFVDGEQETCVTHWIPLPEPPKEDKP